MGLVSKGLLILAAVVGVQIIGSAFIVPPALAAQYALEFLASCCGEEAGFLGGIAVFIGGIALMWFTLGSVWRRCKRITADASKAGSAR